MATVVLAVSATFALAACGGSPGVPASSDPPSPSMGAPAFVPGMMGSVTGTPPADPAALALARDWIAAATPPPGVRPLDTPPAAGPHAPATSAACDWLVQATKWWSTDSAHVASASAWLTQHPVDGLAADGTMTGPGDTSAIIERSPQKGDDSLQFEFVPDGDRVAVRVDVVIVPAGARCASAGAASSAGR